jgi:hypothetical protein
MTCRYARSDSALWRRTHDAVVLLPAGDTEPVTLSDPPARLWDLLAEPISFGEALAALCTGLAGSESPTGQDLTGLLADLERRRLVIVSDVS